MAEVNSPSSEDAVKPNPVANPAMKMIVGLLAAGLWSFAIWVTYVEIPKLREAMALRSAMSLFGSGDSSDSLPRALGYVGWLLPLVAVAGLLVAWRTRSRGAWSFVMLWLPLIVGAGLFAFKLAYANLWMQGLGA